MKENNSILLLTGMDIKSRDFIVCAIGKEKAWNILPFL